MTAGSRRGDCFKEGPSRSSTVDTYLLSTCCVPALCQAAGIRHRLTPKELSLVGSPAGHPRHPGPGLQHPAPYHFHLPPWPEFERTSGTSNLGQKTQRGKGIHPKSQQRGCPSPGLRSTRQLLPRAACAWAVGVDAQPPPLGPPERWVLPRLPGSHSWMVPRGWGTSSSQAICFQERPGPSLMGSRPPSSTLWSDALFIPLPTHKEPVPPPGTQNFRGSVTTNAVTPEAPTEGHCLWGGQLFGLPGL